jgi:hypothetical protein
VSEPAGSQLAAALVQLQLRLPKVGKDKTAKVQPKEGRAYSYTYADLSSISDALLPLLGGVGLAWTASPTLTDDGKFVLDYALLHTSGESRGGRYPLPSGGTPQATGSAITYARRYALCSVTGLAPDADDDGQAAAAHQRQAASRPPAQEAPKSEADQIRDAIREYVRSRNGWNLVTVAQEYAKEYPGRTLKAETDTEALSLFFTNLQVEAQREDDAAKAGAA